MDEKLLHQKSSHHSRSAMSKVSGSSYSKLPLGLVKVLGGGGGYTLGGDGHAYCSLIGCSRIEAASAFLSPSSIREKGTDNRTLKRVSPHPMRL